MDAEVKSISRMNAERRSDCNYVEYVAGEIEYSLRNVSPLDMVKYAMNQEKVEWFSDAFDTVEYKARTIDRTLTEGLGMVEKATCEAKVKALHLEGAKLYEDFKSSFEAWLAVYLETIREMNSELYDDVVRDGQGLIVNE